MTTLEELDRLTVRIKETTELLKDYLRKDPVTKSINRHIKKLRRG